MRSEWPIADEEHPVTTYETEQPTASDTADAKKPECPPYLFDVYFPFIKGEYDVQIDPKGDNTSYDFDIEDLTKDSSPGVPDNATKFDIDGPGTIDGDGSSSYEGDKAKLMLNLPGYFNVTVEINRCTGEYTFLKGSTYKAEDGQDVNLSDAKGKLTGKGSPSEPFQAKVGPAVLNVTTTANKEIK